MHDETTPGMRRLLILAVATIVIGGTIDLLLDRPTSLSFHVVFESAMVVGALTMAVTLWRGWWNAERSVQALSKTLAQRSAERMLARERAKALEGLGQAIDQRFDAWGLTPAEREVALLLLKGYSHKHIARLTGRSDRTVRQHAASAYGKAKLNGRVELAAFFLDDLLLPKAGQSDVLSDR
jgi:DNA-binding CsgD family transcriptional regulator